MKDVQFNNPVGPFVKDGETVILDEAFDVSKLLLKYKVFLELGWIRFLSQSRFHPPLPTIGWQPCLRSPPGDSFHK